MESFTLSQATKALRKSRGIALLYFRPLYQQGVRVQCQAPAAPYPRERPGTHCAGGWVDLRAGLDRCGKSRLHRDSIPGPSCPQAVAISTTLPLNACIRSENVRTDRILLRVLSQEIEIYWKKNRGKLSAVSDRRLAPCCHADSTPFEDKAEQNRQSILSSIGFVAVDKISQPRLLFLASQAKLDFGIQLILFPMQIMTQDLSEVVQSIDMDKERRNASIKRSR